VPDKTCRFELVAHQIPLGALQSICECRQIVVCTRFVVRKVLVSLHIRAECGTIYLHRGYVPESVGAQDGMSLPFPGNTRRRR